MGECCRALRDVNFDARNSLLLAISINHGRMLSSDAAHDKFVRALNPFEPSRRAERMVMNR